MEVWSHEEKLSSRQSFCHQCRGFVGGKRTQRQESQSGVTQAREEVNGKTLQGVDVALDGRGQKEGRR